MVLILNNKNNEEILVEGFELTLVPEESSVLFAAYFSTTNITEMPSFNYLLQYQNNDITSYKLMRDNEILSLKNDFVGKLVAMGESYGNESNQMYGSFNIINQNYIEPTLDPETIPIEDPDPALDPLPDPDPEPFIDPDSILLQDNIESQSVMASGAAFFEEDEEEE